MGSEVGQGSGEASVAKDFGAPGLRSEKAQCVQEIAFRSLEVSDQVFLLNTHLASEHFQLPFCRCLKSSLSRVRLQLHPP